MRKNSKQFVRNVIIAAVVGLVALMAALLLLLQSIFSGTQPAATISQQPEAEIASPKVELSESSLILVHNITEDHIDGYDIKNDKLVSKQFSDTVRISDAYGNVIPITEINIGDIVDVECSQDNGQVFFASKAEDVHSWRKISGIIVDAENEMINIGGTSYKYTDNTMIIKKDGRQESINNIGPYDIVTVQVYDNIIWSIRVDESCASLNVQDLPVSTGTIEIDNSRLINFSDITEPIKVIPGEHKIVIRMPGYEVITNMPTVAAGEVYEISLADAKKAYTIVNVQIYPYIEDYEIKIEDTIYKPGDEIKLQQGEYEVLITAPGYEPRKKKIVLSDKTYPLTVALQKIETEEEEENETPKDEDQAAANAQTITFNTDPSGANVYIDGVNVGKTPYAVTLTYGNHTVLFEEEGYEIYSTSIIVSEENDQKSYLYTLTPR